MASDYYRLLKDAMEKIERLSQPTTRVNRTILEFVGAQDIAVLNETATASSLTRIARAQWGGGVTAGALGGNFKWNLGTWWG